MKNQDIPEKLLYFSILASYGSTVLEAHQLENWLVLLLATNELSSDKDKVNEFEDSFKKLKRLTLGQLINRSIIEFNFSEYWQEELDNMLFFRNQLIHDYSWEITSSMMETDGQIKLLEELNNIRSYFSETTDEIKNRVVKIFSDSHGIPRDSIEEVAKEWFLNAKNER